LSTTAWLVDKSALLRLGTGNALDVWPERVSRGRVRISTITLLEVGCSARNGSDWQSLTHGPPIDAMPVEQLTPATESRALELQGLLARRGQHRAPSIPDLLVAATAELASLVVLHCDKDFELIAELTGQPLERLPE
jgi:predicted nucleic acid-binding protein